MVRLLDPKALPVIGRLLLSPRPRSLAGARVGILWNGRAHGDHIMKNVVERLRAQHGLQLVKVLHKAYIGNVAPQAFFDEMVAARVDAAVVGVGD